MNLVLLRHGESEWNRDNRFTGWTDVDLSDRGRQEAHRAAQLLREPTGFSKLRAEAGEGGAVPAGDQVRLRSGLALQYHLLKALAVVELDREQDVAHDVKQVVGLSDRGFAAQHETGGGL